MKSALILAALVLSAAPAAMARDGAYRCENRYEELLLNAHVSRTTDGDLEIWFYDDEVELVDDRWLGRDLEVTVRVAGGPEQTLICEKR